jgi:hypothetical protein
MPRALRGRHGTVREVSLKNACCWKELTPHVQAICIRSRSIISNHRHSTVGPNGNWRWFLPRAKVSTQLRREVMSSIPTRGRTFLSCRRQRGANHLVHQESFVAGHPRRGLVGDLLIFFYLEKSCYVYGGYARVNMMIHSRVATRTGLPSPSFFYKSRDVFKDSSTRQVTSIFIC